MSTGATLSAPKCGQNLTLIGCKSTSYPALQERVAASGWAVAPKADGPWSKMEHVKSWNRISEGSEEEFMWRKDSNTL